MRSFVFVSHHAPTNGHWPLDDLAGRAGRVDVLCRNVQAAMFLSHGIRADTDVYLVFHQDPANAVTIRIEGAKVQGLNPDERSTAGRLRALLRSPHPDPWWEEPEPGIHIAPFGLKRLLNELDGTPVLLHKDGASLSKFEFPSNPIFILGDHEPLTEDELVSAGDAERVSLGPVWYHGNLVTSVIQYTLDSQGAEYG